MVCVLVRNETDLEFFPYALQSQHRTVMSTPSITTTSMQAEEGKSTTNAPGLKITHDGNQRDQKLSPIDLSTPPSGGISLMDGASKDESSITNAMNSETTLNGNQRDQKLSPFDLSTPSLEGFSMMDGVSKDEPSACLDSSASFEEYQQTISALIVC